MKITVTFEDGDFASLHDTIFDLTGYKFTHEQLEQVWRGLPEDIRLSGLHWGLSDSVVRDNTAEYLDKEIKKANNEWKKYTQNQN